jgi:hypothetical protein
MRHSLLKGLEGNLPPDMQLVMKSSLSRTPLP